MGIASRFASVYAVLQGSLLVEERSEWRTLACHPSLTLRMTLVADPSLFT